MRIFNRDKTKELSLKDVDITKGYLKLDTLKTHIPYQEKVEEQGHYETIMEYENGGKDVKWVIDIEAKEYCEEHDEIEDIQIYIPYTEKDFKMDDLKEKIDLLKEKLSSTDYKAIKYSEGLYTDDEYKSIQRERENIREEINFLEKQIRDIKLYQKDKEE